jgi:hypothetical protein
MPAAIIEQITTAFRSNQYPGDPFLVGSREGCEPDEVVRNFAGMTDWTSIDSELLDECYDALSFFSEAGFRFFLPAFLIADLRGQLRTADPVFHLTHGFRAFSSEYQGLSRVFVRRSGGSMLLNPRRYGAMTWQDHARHRLSVFCREESAAIVEYLRWRRTSDSTGIDAPAIDAALAAFWTERAAHAPTAAQLAACVVEELEYAADLEQKFKGKPGEAD